MQNLNFISESVNHYRNGLLTWDTVRDHAWADTKTIEMLPNDKVLVECRKTGVRATI
jgi:hypothetical protein